SGRADRRNRNAVAALAVEIYLLGGGNLGEMPFHQIAQLREIRATRVLESRHAVLNPANLSARVLDDPSCLGARFAQDELRLFVRLLADVAAQLLRRNQRLVDRLVTLAERAKLLVKSTSLGLELLIQARQSLQFLGHLVAELVHALGIVAANRLAELVAANVE